MWFRRDLRLTDQSRAVMGSSSGCRAQAITTCQTQRMALTFHPVRAYHTGKLRATMHQPRSHAKDSSRTGLGPLQRPVPKQDVFEKSSEQPLRSDFIQEKISTITYAYPLRNQELSSLPRTHRSDVYCLPARRGYGQRPGKPARLLYRNRHRRRQLRAVGLVRLRSHHPDEVRPHGL